MLLPLTRDTGWFFDTELLILAQQAGLRIHEVPVDWIDDSDSRVNVIATILADLRGIARLAFGLPRGSIAVPFLGDAAPPAEHHPGLPGQDGGARSGPGQYGEGQHGRRQDRGRRGLGRQVAGFAAVGAASTVAYILLYLALRGALPRSGRTRSAC